MKGEYTPYFVATFPKEKSRFDQNQRLWLYGMLESEMCLVDDAVGMSGNVLIVYILAEWTLPSLLKIRVITVEQCIRTRPSIRQPYSYKHAWTLLLQWIRQRLRWTKWWVLFMFDSRRQSRWSELNSKWTLLRRLCNQKWPFRSWKCHLLTIFVTLIEVSSCSSKTTTGCIVISPNTRPFWFFGARLNILCNCTDKRVRVRRP